MGDGRSRRCGLRNPIYGDKRGFVDFAAARPSLRATIMSPLQRPVGQPRIRLNGASPDLPRDNWSKLCTLTVCQLQIGRLNCRPFPDPARPHIQRITGIGRHRSRQCPIFSHLARALPRQQSSVAACRRGIHTQVTFMQNVALIGVIRNQWDQWPCALGQRLCHLAGSFVVTPPQNS